MNKLSQIFEKALEGQSKDLSQSVFTDEPLQTFENTLEEQSKNRSQNMYIDEPS